MADPGTLIPSDAAGANPDYVDSFLPFQPVSKNASPFHGASSSGRAASLSEDTSKFGTLDQRSKSGNSITEGKESVNKGENILSSALVEVPMKGQKGSEQCNYGSEVKRESALETSTRPTHSHARSPSWTEGVGSPAVRKKKVKDVSKYMIEAAKENPQLAQKLHDVLLESGVVAPPNLFSEVYTDQLEVKSSIQENDNKGFDDKHKGKGFHNFDRSSLPPLPHQGLHSRGNVDKHPYLQLDLRDLGEHDVSSDSEATPVKYTKNVPVAAAAAAAAAVVASSMVVAAAKASSDSKLQLPVAAAATATAAAVVATTAAVTKQYEALESALHSPDNERGSSGDRGHGGSGASSGGERISDRSTENESSKSDSTMDDVADCEIPWEDITLGERIGLGILIIIFLILQMLDFISDKQRIYLFIEIFLLQDHTVRYTVETGMEL